jgi:hypothetical protein
VDIQRNDTQLESRNLLHAKSNLRSIKEVKKYCAEDHLKNKLLVSTRKLVLKKMKSLWNR